MAQVRIILFLVLAYDVFAILQHKEWFAESQMTKIRSVENAKMILVKPTARMIVRSKVY